MALMQLKMPPERAALMANAIEHHIESGDAGETAAELEDILVWLRYRIARWNKHHTDPTAD